jgi:regulator of sirC expression with transglutaminase-like and TPR domain
LVEVAQRAAHGNPLALRFAELLAGPEENIVLSEAALLLASHQYPNLDVSYYLGRLRSIADGLKPRIAADATDQKKIVALNHYLFQELGFAPNADDYYDPRNSFLNEVLERRLGIPISLSILYMDIGEKIGLSLQGICFPGHFLVKCKLSEGVVILDPYRGGGSLTVAELQRRLREVRGGEVSRAIIAGLLVASSNKEILLRMLRNLKAIYLRSRRLDHALTILEWIVAAAPDQGGELRDRGMVYQELDCFRAAVADFQRYLQLEPACSDADDIRKRLVELQRSAARLN